MCSFKLKTILVIKSLIFIVDLYSKQLRSDLRWIERKKNLEYILREEKNKAILYFVNYSDFFAIYQPVWTYVISNSTIFIELD